MANFSLALCLRDLSVIDETNESMVDDRINFKKMELLASPVSQIMNFQKNEFRFSRNLKLKAYLLHDIPLVSEKEQYENSQICQPIGNHYASQFKLTIRRRYWRFSRQIAQTITKLTQVFSKSATIIKYQPWEICRISRHCPKALWNTWPRKSRFKTWKYAGSLLSGTQSWNEPAATLNAKNVC
jgi:hypothetical protein